MNKKMINKYILGAMIFAPSTMIINNNDNVSIVSADALSDASDAVTLAENTRTVSNIRAARTLVNALPEGSEKNDLQVRLNAIYNIEGNTLDRNSASANVDIYIKCENLLSLSLSTNSISFENFSGTEDMAKPNAVTLSVNSSLPYDVNSYLPTDIIGSENGNIMNKDILEIKANGESAYQKFPKVGTAEDCKVTLLSAQEAGNGKSHGIDLNLVGNIAHEKDIYKATVKFEVVQN